MTDNKTRWWVHVIVGTPSSDTQKLITLYCLHNNNKGQARQAIRAIVMKNGVIGIDDSEGLGFQNTNSWWNKGGVPEGVLREFFMLLLDVDLTEDYTSKDYYA